MTKKSGEKAKIVWEREVRFSDGAILEGVIWQLPRSDSERPHGLKYSLFYGYPGERVIGYDNERGKGDHRHYREHEEPYTFVDEETLIDDFMADVVTERSKT